MPEASLPWRADSGDRFYINKDLRKQAGAGSLAELHEGALGPHVGADALLAILQAEAAHLPAADGHLGGRLAPGVDPGDAGVQLADHVLREADVGRDDAGGEAHGRVVGAAHHLGQPLVLRAAADGVGQHAHDGAENLFAGHAHVVGAAGKDDGRHPVAAGRGLAALGVAGAVVEDPGAVDVLAVADVGEDLVAVLGRHDGAKVDRLVARHAHADALAAALDEGLLDGGQQRVGHKDAGAVGADLAGGEEVGRHGHVGGLVRVRVGEDDDGALAAELHGDALHVLGGRGGNLAAGADLAGEGDLGDARVGDEGHAGARAVAVDDVEDARGHAGLDVDLGERVCVQRRDLAGLVDHAVAGGEARGRLPEGDLDGVVPGTDAGADAEGLVGGEDVGVAAEAGVLAGLAPGDQVGVVLEHVGAGDDVDGRRLGPGLARVERLGQGEGVVART
ncbi:hypothetical protein HC256_008421 [Beauveria bassiana]|nr:hypothetical protein HC256_008421 [Beauveria bassiana]